MRWKAFKFSVIVTCRGRTVSSNSYASFIFFKEAQDALTGFKKRHEFFNVLAFCDDRKLTMKRRSFKLC